MTSFIDLSTYGLIKLTGNKVVDFLQGQFTNDIVACKNNQSSFGAYCNIKGRVQAFMLVIKLQDAIYLRMPRELTTTVSTEIAKFARFSRVTVEDVSDQYNLVGVIGELPPELNITAALQDFDVLTIDTGYIVKLPGGDKARFILFTEKNNTTTQISINASFEKWELTEIQHHIPEIFSDTYEQFLPHSLGMLELGALSLSKGCYRGQEIVARMHYRGNIKKHMYQCISQVPVKAGDTIIAGSTKKKVGTVIRQVYIEKKYYLLAELQDEYTNQEVHVEALENEPLQVVLHANS